MRNEMIAVHGRYDVDPTTKAIAVSIYQTVAYQCDSAEHTSTLFNLEGEGNRYSRISSPTTSVLERWVAALEGGVEALAVITGQAALNYSVLNVSQVGNNIVSVPHLYGTTHTLFVDIPPSLGTSVRCTKSDDCADIERLTDADTRAVLCESVGNAAGNICDIEALANIAHKHGVRSIVDNTVARPILLRPIDYRADIVVRCLTKFMGGHEE
jgi:O-acetylhomoserine (thiol)-lyase